MKVFKSTSAGNDGGRADTRRASTAGVGASWRVAVLAAVCAAALTATAASAEASALTATRSVGSTTQRVVATAGAFAIENLTKGGRILSTEIIDYRHRVVTLVDATRHDYQTLPLSTAVAQALSERRLELRAGPSEGSIAPHKPETAVRTHLSRRIHGVLTHAWLLRMGNGDVARAWYAQTPAPPAPVNALLSQLGPAGGRGLAVGVALLVEDRVAGHWRTESRAQSVSGRAPRGMFRIPRGTHRGPVLTSGPGHRPRSTPAHLSQQFAYFPVEAHQAVFAVFQGARFAREPGTVSRLDDALSRVIEASPYNNGLRQYGIQNGRLVGHLVDPRNPPSVIGDTSAAGFAAGLPIVTAARLDGAPPVWLRTAATDPLVVVFVPAESVDASDNSGYHSVVPVETALLDPLGLFQIQVYPYAVIKVPPLSDSSAIDEATTTLSHEAVEAATDPVTIPAGWVDTRQTALHNEAADVCHEGTHAPWGDTTRVGGVAVATYWSNSDNACVPESRPTVRILTPADDADVPMGHGVALAASASDPLDGTLTGTRVQWTDNLQGPLGPGTNLVARLVPGLHVIRATATDSQGLVAHDTVNVLVVASPPTAHITNPPDGSTFGTDETITFTGNAQDPQDGELAEALLHWKVFRGFTLVADLGSGSSASDRITTEGTYTVQLTATDAEGLTSAPVSITLVIGPPAGNPSATIDSPLSGSSFYSGSCTSTVNVSFQGHATDPTDGTLSGGQLAWYVDYGTAQQTQIGTGNSFTAPIAQSCNFQQTHTITLVATDSRGHQSTYTITIVTGAPS